MKHAGVDGRLSRGFTLIESMIAVAILGVLTAIALPGYQAHVARSQAARVMGEAASLRVAVEICLAEGRTTGMGSGATECDPAASGSTLMALPATHGAAPSASLPAGLGVPAVTFPAMGGARIEVVFGHSAASAIAGERLAWVFSENAGWVCTSSLMAVFRPAACS